MENTSVMRAAVWGACAPEAKGKREVSPGITIVYSGKREAAALAVASGKTTRIFNLVVANGDVRFPTMHIPNLRAVKHTVRKNFISAAWDVAAENKRLSSEATQPQEEKK
jgi:hypothetical protein